MNGVAKGLSVFGDTLKASQYYQMFLYGRQATPRLSEDFILSTAPTLAQELRGSSYGRAVSAFNRAIVGGRMTGDAMREIQTLGLVGADDLDKKGKLKAGRSIAGWELAQTDPNAWVRQFLLPAMQRQGITDPATVSKVIGELFSNQLAAQMVSILATQQAKIDKDQALVHGAMGLEGANYALRNDPEIAGHALLESAKNLAATLGEGLARSLAPIMADLATAIAGYTAKITANNEFIKNHPGADTPIDKESRLGFNALAFGIDSDKGYADIPETEKLEAAYQKRRALLLKWRDEKLDDPAKVAAIEERRKHVAPGFEASAKAQDDAEEYPMRAAADKQLADLERAHEAFLRTKVAASREIEWAESHPIAAPRAGKAPFLISDAAGPPAGGVTMPGPVLPALPDLGQLLGGKVEASLKPDQITAKIEGQVEGRVIISLDLSPDVKATLKSATGGSSEHFKLDLGTSMPNAEVGARKDVGR